MMKREDCRLQMFVVFGRRNGEQTTGKITKLNPKKACVETVEDRGSKSKAGEIWHVPYSMIRPATDAEIAKAQQAKQDATKTALYDLVRQVALQEGTTLQGALRDVLTDLRKVCRENQLDWNKAQEGSLAVLKEEEEMAA